MDWSGKFKGAHGMMERVGGWKFNKVGGLHTLPPDRATAHTIGQLAVHD